MFFWQFNSEWYWTQEKRSTGGWDCCHATEVRCQKASKSQEESHITPVSDISTDGPIYCIVSIGFAASSHNTRWISLAFLIDAFSSFFSSSPIPFIFAFPFSSSYQNDGFCKRSCHIPPYSTLHKTLVYSREWGVWWKPASSEKIGCRQSPHFPPSSW